MVSDMIIRELADNLDRAGLVDMDGSSLANDTNFRNAVIDAWETVKKIVSQPRTPLPKTPEIDFIPVVPTGPARVSYTFNVGSGTLKVWQDHEGNNFLAVTGYDKITLNEEQINGLAASLRMLKPHQGG